LYGDSTSIGSGLFPYITANLTSVQVFPSAVCAGPSVASSPQILFITANAVPVGGSIVVTFPSGFTFAPAVVASPEHVVGIVGSLTSVVSSQSIVITGWSSPIAAKTAVELYFSSSSLYQVFSPSTPGITASFSVHTTSDGSSILDQASNIPGSKIIGCPTSVILSTTTINSATGALISFGISLPIQLGGGISFLPPTGMTIASHVTGTFIGRSDPGIAFAHAGPYIGVSGFASVLPVGNYQVAIQSGLTTPANVTTGGYWNVLVPDLYGDPVNTGNCAGQAFTD